MEFEGKKPMGGAAKIKMDPEAWQAGFEAGKAGRDSNRDCPYPAVSDKALAWYSGFIEGKASRQAKE
jgi:ribosome modulation factor